MVVWLCDNHNEYQLIMISFQKLCGTIDKKYPEVPGRRLGIKHTDSEMSWLPGMLFGLKWTSKSAVSFDYLQCELLYDNHRTCTSKQSWYMYMSIYRENMYMYKKCSKFALFQHFLDGCGTTFKPSILPIYLVHCDRKSSSCMKPTIGWHRSNFWICSRNMIRIEITVEPEWDLYMIQ